MAKSKSKALSNKTCREMAALLLDFMNDKLSPAIKRDFQQHLKICPDCVNFLKSYKKIVQATQALPVDQFPSQVRANVLAFLRKRVGRIGAYLLPVCIYVILASGILGVFLTR